MQLAEPYPFEDDFYMAQRMAYGTWPSPISPRMLAGQPSLIDVQWVRGSNGNTDEAATRVVWLENRAGESGLWTMDIADSMSEAGAPRNLNEGEGIRGRVGYGGGEFTTGISAEGKAFVIYAGHDGRLFRQSLDGGKARAITPSFGVCAAPALSPDGAWVAYVHHDGDLHGTDGIAIVDAHGRMFPQKLAFGTDFAMQPTWSADGTMLAYIAWDHPHMPWDATQLHLARLDYSGGMPQVEATRVLAGGGGAGGDDISIFQPEFSPDGTQLAYVSDESGRAQLYACDLETGTTRQLTRVHAEHATPAWVQGLRTFGWRGNDHLVAIRNQGTTFSLVQINLRKGGETALPLPGYTYLEQIHLSPDGARAAVLAESTTTPTRALVIDLPGPSSESPQATPAVHLLRRSTGENIAPASLCVGQPVSWTGDDGETVYGLYYPPAGTHEGIGLPPLLVHIHGGPTSQSFPSYSAEAQFWATRGFAFLMVNHRGSTGYGKAYKDKHRGAWGIYDVQDAASGASALAARGLADPAKFIIIGGSAGGYTVLQSLVDLPGFYKAGVCRYGISNQFTLVMEAGDKFEARYSETLLGTLPEAAARYRDRSPVLHAERITDPVILFQGADDTNVPQSQSDSIAAALAARGVPHEYHVYPGEGHGFRKPATIEDYYNKALSFLLRHVVYT